MPSTLLLTLPCFLYRVYLHVVTHLILHCEHRCKTCNMAEDRVWWHGQLEPEERALFASMLRAWRDYSQQRMREQAKMMQRNREYAALEAKAAQKNEKHLISWVTFRRWEIFVKNERKERHQNSPNYGVPEEIVGKKPIKAKVVWEPLGPVGEFYSNGPQMPRKRPSSKKTSATQAASVVIVKTEINRKFKTPAGSPALRSVPTLMMGRHGMHQFVDKKRLKYKNQMWRYRTNAVANSKRNPSGSWVSRSATPSGTSHISTRSGQERSASAPPPAESNQDESNESANESEPVVPSVPSSSTSEGITTACSSYTIQYASLADPRTEDAGQTHHKPTPPVDAKKSRSIEQTKTVRKMYRRKFGNQKHRLSHVDQLTKKKIENSSTHTRSVGISTGTDSEASAYNSYYSFLQTQVSSIS